MGAVDARVARFGGQPGDPVSGVEMSIEEHGDGEALYIGRGPGAHGLNIVHLTEPAYQWADVRALIVEAVNALPVLLSRLEAAEAVCEADAEWDRASDAYHMFEDDDSV